MGRAGSGDGILLPLTPTSIPAAFGNLEVLGRDNHTKPLRDLVPSSEAEYDRR